MKIHNLAQGSPEWHAHRSNYWNASDAPAMMGASKHETRSEFLHRISTGIAPDVNSYTQRMFDEGHLFEALARPLAEEIIGESLYPVTGTEGKYSASFDGLTMLEDFAYEHKRLNDAIRAAQTVADLDAMYHIQMEQQCLVSGAKRVLFLASNWDDEGRLLEEKHFWYEPSMKLRERIIQGWIQLEKDRDAHVHVVHPEKPQAEAIMQLPALAVQIRGEVTSSNLKQYREAAEQFIACIKTDLQTDEDFANAEETVKFCDKAEKELELTKKAAIAQTVSVDELMRTIDHIKNQLRDKRLMLDKLVKTQKEAIKATILADAKAKFAAHVSALASEIKEIKFGMQEPPFFEAMKNKRTLASLHDAVDTALANAKILANEIAGSIRAKLAWHKEQTAGYEFLFSDLQQIAWKEADDFQMLVQNRIAQHKADEAKKLEAERARIRLEEEAKARAKAEAEARAKAEAERRAQAEEEQKAKAKLLAEQAIVEAERKRLSDEEQRKIEAALPHLVAAPPAAEVVKPSLVKTDAAMKERGHSLMLELAINDLTFFRKKYGGLAELSGVMREINSFLEPEARRA